MFVHIVLICDGHLCIKDYQSKFAKFMNIVKQLPMGLQMKICNNVYGIDKENIPSIDFEDKLKGMMKKLIL